MEWFKCQIQKLTYGAFFPLNFHHWVGICGQLWLLVKTIEFWNTLCSNLINNKVNFKIPCLLTFFNSDLKFVFCDKSWVGKYPIHEFLELVLKSFKSDEFARKKSIIIHDLNWCQKLPGIILITSTNVILKNILVKVPFWAKTMVPYESQKREKIHISYIVYPRKILLTESRGSRSFFILKSGVFYYPYFL